MPKATQGVDPSKAWNIPAHASPTYKNIMSYFESCDKECDRVKLEPSHDDYELPEWLNGAFVQSGPSVFETKKRHFGNLADGFGRFSRFDIKNGEVHFSSKMLNSKFYQVCKSKDDIVTTFLFKETTPPRWGDKLPLLNMIMPKYGDNNWVSLEKLGDEFYVTTDTPQRYVFDLDKLQVVE